MTIRDRLRALRTTQPAALVNRWCAAMPDPQPIPDIGAAVATVTAWIDQHVAAGSIDEAHAAVLDRMLEAITDQWREDAKRHYLKQERQLAETRRDGVQYMTVVGRELELVTLDCARHREFYAARWNELTASERAYLKDNPVTLTTETSPLPNLAAHELLALPTGHAYPPFADLADPAVQDVDRAALHLLPVAAQPVTNHHPANTANQK